ncbi:DNA-3-methyladenine glycosylase family protein [Chloroflexus aggregans]|uniref:DNA-3-methyladenine glycosylase II n=1 Tax=Chloroflexus aggregans (strain MD-66 / DSM 9485) TaxID=326427 RepID=B8GAB8_CHLAD|nr:DNA-3-methyladenine glycosylase [Chloroflexus aggregans]ACL26493.1 DNA-3-methyladenine glycosylase II [Chloroflexus aggregans DSM 9485]
MEQALNYLCTVDPVLAPWIDQIGSFALQRQPHSFATLAYAIISQQLSLNAARAIRDRLTTLLGELTPEQILAADTTALRAAGLSMQKSGYLRDLAERIVYGQINLELLPTLDDETAIAMLTNVRGIGRWTAEIYLMFALNRLDILPADDLGLRDGARLVYQLPQILSPRELRALGERWRPYRSIACWYLWQIRHIMSKS